MGTLGAIGYEVGQQLNGLANDLPEIERNINRKIQRLKPNQAGAITKVQEVVGDVGKSLSPKKDDEVQDVRVITEPDFSARCRTSPGPTSKG